MITDDMIQQAVRLLFLILLAIIGGGMVVGAGFLLALAFRDFKDRSRFNGKD